MLQRVAVVFSFAVWASLSTHPVALGQAAAPRSDQAALARYAKAAGAGAETTWEATANTRDRRHRRYRQHVDGVGVVGGVAIVHTPADGGLASVTGAAYATPAARAPRLGKREATDLARRELRDAAADFRQTGTVELVYVDAHFPRRTGRLRLAYAVDLAAEQPQRRRRVYVDAVAGRVLGDYSLLQHAGVPGSVPTRYSGRQAVTVDSLGVSWYSLRDSARNVTVTTATLDGEVPRSPTPDFAPGAGEFGAMMGDVYYGAAKFYDLFADSLGWRGLDGAGEELRGHVDDLAGEGYVNAYWNGSESTFGQGDCHYAPLTTLDVVGHEFMHGITQRTSDLIYAGESGALNEGFSDIFGKALERVVAPERFSWELGNGFADGKYAEDFRSMADPRIHGNPMVYGGEYWHERNGVHTNSGPLGHWFYLLIEGGAGTNELGDDYDVAPVDIYAALRVAFATTRDYLTESSDYAEAREGSLLAAAEAYGDSSDVYRSVAQAWRAIGVKPRGDEPVEEGIYDLVLDTVYSDFVGCFADGGVTFDLSFANEGNTVIPEDAQAFVTLTTADGYVAEQPIWRYGDLEPQSGTGTNYTFDVPLAPGAHQVSFAVEWWRDNVPENDETAVEAAVITGVGALELRRATWTNEDCRGDLRELLLDYELQVCDYGAYDTLRESFTADLLGRDGSVLASLGYPEDRDYFSTWGVGLDVYTPVATRTYAIRLRVGPSDTTVQLDGAASPYLLADQVLDFDGADTLGEPVLAPVGWWGSLGYVGRVGVGPGDTLLATTGIFGESVPCLQASDNLSQRWTTDLSVCVDYGGVDAPTLGFDVLQLHGEAPEGYGELIGSARALRVSWGGVYDPNPWDDDEPESAFAPDHYDIGSTRDGVREAQRVRLPDGYRGAVRLAAYNASGSAWEFADGADAELERFDYVMVDDFGVERRATAVAEVAEGYFAAPNPADDLLLLTAPPGPAEPVRVYGPLGRLTYAGETLAGAQVAIPTAGWPAGVYVLVVGEEAGMRQRLVVQH